MSSSVKPRTSNVKPKSSNVKPKSSSVKPKSSSVKPKSSSVKPKSNPIITTKSKPVTKSETKNVIKSKTVQRPQTKTVQKLQTKTVQKTTSKPVQKTTSKPVQKTTTKPVQKTTSKPTQRPQSRTEQRPQSRTEQRPQSRTEQRPQSRTETKIVQRPQTRTETKIVQRPQSRTEQRPQTKIVQRPQSRTEQRPQTKIVQRPQTRTETKIVQRPQTRSQFVPRQTNNTERKSTTKTLPNEKNNIRVKSNTQRMPVNQILSKSYNGNNNGNTYISTEHNPQIKKSSHDLIPFTCPDSLRSSHNKNEQVIIISNVDNRQPRNIKHIQRNNFCDVKKSGTINDIRVVDKTKFVKPNTTNTTNTNKSTISVKNNPVKIIKNKSIELNRTDRTTKPKNTRLKVTSGRSNNLQNTNTRIMSKDFEYEDDDCEEDIDNDVDIQDLNSDNENNENNADNIDDEICEDDNNHNQDRNNEADVEPVDIIMETLIKVTKSSANLILSELVGVIYDNTHCVGGMCDEKLYKELPNPWSSRKTFTKAEREYVCESIEDCNVSDMINRQTDNDVDLVWKFNRLKHDSTINLDVSTEKYNILSKPRALGYLKRFSLKTDHVLFEGKISISNNCVIDDHKGSNHCLINLPKESKIIINDPTLNDFVKALYALKNNKFDKWFEMYKNAVVRDVFGVKTIELFFDIGCTN
jgi:hypothetical protein